MWSLSFYLLLLISLAAIAMPTTISATKIGVTYSTPASTSGSVLISPEKVVAKIISMKIEAVRLVDPNPEMIRAFANTNVSLFLSVPNHVVPLLASDRSLALDWVNRHVLPFHRRTKISIISVGNDVISLHTPDVPPLFLLRAMKNVHRSLSHLRIDNISISTTFSFFSIVPTDIPPFSVKFEQPNGEVIMRPILNFLERTNSSFLVNIHPYHMYRSSCSVPIEFALFRKSPLTTVMVDMYRIRYHNLFDMMVDAVIRSMAAMGHENIPVIVAETGWPSSGNNASEVDATLRYSRVFLKALTAHLTRGRGTPLRKEGVSEVYIFELVDHEAKQGIRNWGILHHDLTGKYISDVAVALTKFVLLATWVLLIRNRIEWGFRRLLPRPGPRVRTE